MIHLRPRTVAGALLLSAGALSLAAGPASANVSPTLSLTPSTTQAGAAPTLTLDAKFNYSDGSDTVRNATVSFPGGLLANPQAPTAKCTASQLSSGSCPAASKIGHGFVTASAGIFGNQTLNATLYLMVPQSSSEFARIGVVASNSISGTVTASAPVTARTSPSAGFSFTLQNLPNQASGISIQITEVNLVLAGTVDGHRFTRNPTGCSPAVTSASISTYENSSQVAVTSRFTPTGCSSEAYAPRLGASATKDTGDDGVAVTVTSSQSATGSATRSAKLTLPKSLVPRAATIAAANAGGCGKTNLAACPVIGSATLSTPLLAAPLTGTLYLVGTGGSGLPGITALFGGALPYQLDGKSTTSAAGLSESFSLIDAPISSLAASFQGGTTSLFQQGTGLCAAPGKVNGSFGSWSGKIASVSSALACH